MPNYPGGLKPVSIAVGTDQVVKSAARMTAEKFGKIWSIDLIPAAAEAEVTVYDGLQAGGVVLAKMKALANAKSEHLVLKIPRIGADTTNGITATLTGAAAECYIGVE